MPNCSRADCETGPIEGIGLIMHVRISAIVLYLKMIIPNKYTV